MRKHWTVYGALASNVARRVMVCVVFMPAGHTRKTGLAFPVALVGIPARAALPARVARIDGNNRNSGLLGLVLHKTSQLPKGPVVQAFPLLFVGLNPRADMRQIFERDTEAGAFRSGDNCFGNTVIFVFLKSLLLAADGAKSALCRPSADPLQGGSPLGVARPVSLDLGAGVLVSKTVRCKVDDAEINSEYAFWREQLRVVKVANGGQIPLAAHEHQVHLALAMLQQLALMVAADVRNLGAPCERPDRNQVAGHQSDDPIVIRLRRVLSENPLHLLVSLVGVGGFLDTLNRCLSRQGKSFAQVPVVRLLQVVLAKHLRLKRLRRQPVARLVASLQRCAKQLFLLRVGLQSKVGNEFHYSSIDESLMQIKRCALSISVPLSLPIPEGMGFSGGFR